jgi:hypothetical protein
VLLLRPARLRVARVVNIMSGERFHQAQLHWGYCPGLRPQSLILDLAGTEASGSLTCDGKEREGSIPLAKALSGDYTLTATATYRVLGFPVQSQQAFHGKL